MQGILGAVSFLLAAALVSLQTNDSILIILGGMLIPAVIIVIVSCLISVCFSHLESDEEGV